jgi:hypothetical protein
MGLMMGELVDTADAARTTSGDPPFEGLFRAYADRLVRLPHLLGTDDPEDVVQKAFCRFSSSGTIGSTGAPLPLDPRAAQIKATPCWGPSESARSRP